LLYGWETWSLTLREENRQRAFENTAMRKMFYPKRKEVKGCWRRVPNEELHNFSPCQILMS
jgi:hypothetical protein